uniref:Uridine 5'-monophosphate synthase n=1 Tax=Panagrolaimus superbus TaxID=310955 RepID=A0A914Z6I8_9BILA
MSTDLFNDFHRLEVFKLGNFVLKSGLPSPIYIDLRALISDPKLLKHTCHEMTKLIKEKAIDYDYIVGVPYAALPMATLISSNIEAPMLIKRKEAKAYGTKKLIEGSYETGKKCLIIEDVVTSGASILETVEALKQEGLICVDVICALDREQGGVQRLEKEGINLHSLVSMTAILDYLVSSETISAERREEIEALLKNTSLANTNAPEKENGTNGTTNSWNLESRKSLLEANSLNLMVLNAMLKKQTNLCVAVDETSKEKILQTVQSIGGYVCAIKLHADIIDDFDQSFVEELTTLSKQLNFVIFADRKLADTGNTVELQLTHGNLRIADWANVVTVHSVPGPSILQSVGNIIKQNKALKGALLIASLSSKGALTDVEYSKKSLEMAKDAKEVVSGFICQKRPSENPAFFYWTPGVNESKSTDGLGQQWRSVEDAIKRDGNDIIIVGRAITQSSNPAETARDYATRAFELWKSR